MNGDARLPRINELYQQYLVDQDAAAFLHKVNESYAVVTLERLATGGQRLTRRAAVMALGLVGNFDTSNAVLGRGLVDVDRGVRTLAENAIRAVWCRVGDERQRRRLNQLMALNAAQRFEEAIRQASRLIDAAPELAEGWNQRAIAYFATGRYADSIYDCEQALERNPYHFGAAAGMGQCYLQLGDREAALMNFRRALRLNPGLEGVRAQVVYLQRTLHGQE